MALSQVEKALVALLKACSLPLGKTTHVMCLLFEEEEKQLQLTLFIQDNPAATPDEIVEEAERLAQEN